MLKYQEWLKSQIKYADCKCGVAGCHERGLYEGGDARCWFPMCEQHADMRTRYLHYLPARLYKIEQETDVETAYKQILERKQKLENRITEVLYGTD